MIEVLVSLTIVAFGVLGLLGLQARALSFQRDSFDRRTAAEMVAQLAERIRANHLGLTTGLYAPPTAADLDAHHADARGDHAVCNTDRLHADRTGPSRLAAVDCRVSAAQSRVPLPTCNGIQPTRALSRCRSRGPSRSKLRA